MGKFAGGIAGGIGGGLVGSLLSGLMGGSQKPAAQPAPTPMPAAPDSNDPMVREAKRKKAAEIQNRSGRTSTLLSDMGTSDKLGG